MNRNYNSLDVTKFVMSIFVVVIHCFIINDVTEATNVYVGNGVNTLIRQAVPFFFATSAFLLFSKIRSGVDGFRGKLRKYLSHIGRMYVVWFFIFIAIAVVKMDGTEICDYLVDRGYSMIFWGGGHLWYLWATLLVMPLLAALAVMGGALSKPRKTYIYIMMGIIGMCFFRFYSHYGSVEEPTWWQVPLVWGWQGHVFNVFGVCDAFMYLSIGLFFALTDVWKRWNKWVLIGVIILGFLYSHFDNGEPSMGCIPMSFAIMALTLRWKAGGNNAVYKYLRNMSTFIYLVHPICIGWAHRVTENPFVMTVWSIVFSIMIAFAFVALNNKVYVLKKLV